MARVDGGWPTGLPGGGGGKEFGGTHGQGGPALPGRPGAGLVLVQPRPGLLRSRSSRLVTDVVPDS